MGKKGRRHITAELILSRREGKGRKKEWQPRGDLIPPNKAHALKKGESRRRNWREYLDYEEGFIEEE